MLFDPVVYVFREIEIAGDTYFQYFGLASECEVEEGTYIVPEDELARKLGISRSSVMNFERAPYDNFSIHTLKRIAQIFDVNLVAYFEEKEPTEPISLIADED